MTKVNIDEIEAKWLTDLESYARDQLLIQPMPEADAPEIGGTQLEPLIFNEPQMILDGIIQRTRAEGRLVRLIILKARREGISTYVSGRFYWMTTTRFNRYAMLIAHEPESTEFLFQMHKRFLQHNPFWQPKTRYNNKRLLDFNTPDGKGLGSAIRVATAGKEDIGSSQATHYLHLSEMAKWPANTVKPILNSVFQCVPKSVDSEVIIESTAKGVGGEFYDMFWASRHRCYVVLKDGKPAVEWSINEDADELDEFTSVFLPWFVFSRYQMDPPEDFKRTEDEQKMADTYGLTDRHLAWRRWCIANNCNRSEDTFRQEYPSNPEEAFLSTGNNVFDNPQLVRLRDLAPKPKYRYSVRITDAQFIASETGELLVWEEAVPNEDYLVSADVGEGINRNTSGKIADWSCAHVWKLRTSSMVAEWHGKIDPDLFGIVLYCIGMRYNRGIIVPERNNHGQATVLKLVDLRYPRLYVERVPEPPNKTRKRYGWLTTRVNKRDIVDNLLAEMRDGTHGIVSRDVFSEMISFKQEGTEYGAEVGKFDDRVLSVMIGKHVLPRFRGRQYAKGVRTFTDSPADRGTGAPPPIEAWVV